MLKLKRNRDYLLTILIIAILFFIICAVKNIFPFGTARIDTSDFEQESVPVYYHLWDVLHGKADLFFSEYAGGGLGFAGVSSFFALISPFSLFFLFIKRSWIEPSMTFYILIKFIAMGSSMCFFLKNFWKDRAKNLPSLWIITGSAAYGLSAWAVQYYLFPWLDIAAVFPLLIYSFLQMISKEYNWKIGKYSVGYLLLLTLVFIMHIPQAYMVCLYLILLAGCYFFTSVMPSRHHKNEHSSNPVKRQTGGVLKFALLSLLALALSAFIFLPGALSIMSSGRMSEGKSSLWTKYLHFLQEPGIDPSVKRIMLYSMFIPLAYLIVTIRNKNKDKRLAEYLMVIASILPVFFESINVIWLMGPYNGFPMRYGYMMIFTILAAAGNRMSQRISAHALAFETHPSSVHKLAAISIAGIWLIGVLGLGTWLIRAGVSGDEGSFVQNSEEIKELLPSDSDLFHKTKLADSSLNNNYPLITKTTAFSNYIHLVSQEQIDFNNALGYAQTWTRISDTGGTLFSDALLGYDITLYTTLAGEQGFQYHTDHYSLYKSLGESQRFAVYANQYNYPPGLTVSKNALNTFENTIYSNPFELQNALSQLFWAENLFTVSDYEILEEGTILCPVSGNSVLYLYSDDIKDAVVSVNGQDVPVPDFFYGINDCTYPTPHHGGILSLGCYSDETVEVKIRHQSWAENIETSHISIALMDLQKFIETTRVSVPTCSYTISNTGLSLTLPAKEASLLYLPLYTDSGWTCRLNGEPCSIQSLANTFMLIPLQEGENAIELTYSPTGFKTGTVLSVLALLVLIIWGIVSKVVRNDKSIEKIYTLASYMAASVFGIVFVGYMVLVYIVPVGYEIIGKW